MKSIKKFNLDERLKNLKVNFKSKFKYFLILPALIVVAGIVLLCTLGFAKSIDFTGGYIAKVYIGEEYTFEQATQKIDEVLNGKGLQASLYQASEDDGENYVTVKYKINSDLTDLQLESINNEIVDELFTSFGYDSEDMQQSSYVVGNQKIDASLGQQALVNTFSIIVLSSVIMIVYFIIRFGHSSAMTALLAIYHDLLIALSFALIIRIEINMTFLSALVAIFVYSFINNSLFFSKVKRNIEEKTPKNELAEKSLKEYLYFELIMTWLVLIMLVLFSVVGVSSILPFTIITIFGVLASFYSTVFLTPTLWSFVYIPTKKKPKPENESKEIVW